MLKLTEAIQNFQKKYNAFIDKLEFNINHPDVVINNVLSKLFNKDIYIRFRLIERCRQIFNPIKLDQFKADVDDENGIEPYYIINDDEKTDNWLAAVLKALVIAIHIHSITSEFEAIIQTYNRSFNFNEWFESLSYKTKSIITDIFVEISTIFHTAFKGRWDTIEDFLTGKTFDKVLDNEFGNSPGKGQIPFFCMLFDSVDILGSYIDGDYTYDQALLSFIFDVALIGLAFAFSDVGFVVGTAGVIKFLGDNTRDGIFNYENGHLWG